MNSHKCGYSECNNCNKYVGKSHKCFMKKVKAKGGYCTVDIVRNIAKIMIQLERKIGAIHVDPTQRNIYFMTSKQLKTQVPIPLTFQSHKTSVVEGTYTTLLRSSTNVS